LRLNTSLGPRKGKTGGGLKVLAIVLIALRFQGLARNGNRGRHYL